MKYFTHKLIRHTKRCVPIARNWYFPSYCKKSCCFPFLRCALLAASITLSSFNTTQAQQPTPEVLPAGQLPLSRLVDLASQRLSINIEYDASTLRGEVTLRLGSGITDDELWQLMNRLLAARGYTTIRMAGSDTLSVVRSDQAAGLAVIENITTDQAAPESTRPGFATTVLRPRYRAADELLAAINGLLSKSGKASQIGTTGLLLISDLSPRVVQALSLIDLLDVANAAVVVQEIELEHIGPEHMTTLAAQVAAKRKAVGGRELTGELLESPTGRGVLLIAPEDELTQWRDLITLLDRRPAVQTLDYSPRFFLVDQVAQLIEQTIGSGSIGAEGAAMDDRWRVVIDELTSTLIITATSKQHERIVALLARLDAAPPETRRAVRSVEIRNRSADELRQVLEQLLTAGVFETGRDRGSGRDAGTNEASPVDANRSDQSDQLNASTSTQSNNSSIQTTDSQSDVVLTTDESTNTLIVIGPPRLLDQVESLIEELDVRQPQVMLEAILVSLTEGQSRDLGIELEKIEISGDTMIRISSLFGLSSGSSGARSVGDGAGFTGVVLSPGDFSIIIRALETVNQGRSLSRPRILVGNNEQATFNSVIQEPFVNTNASDTVATTSFGGFESAGTTIAVTPQIAAGDHLLLEYTVSLSSFVGESSAAGVPPPRQENSVASRVTIPDGHTVVVGGLEQLNEGEALTKIPLLSDLPILGELFKNRSASNSRSRFYVFIRADVQRGPGFESLKYISAQDMAAAGIDDGWPQVQPRVIR